MAISRLCEETEATQQSVADVANERSNVAEASTSLRSPFQEPNYWSELIRAPVGSDVCRRAVEAEHCSNVEAGGVLSPRCSYTVVVSVLTVAAPSIFFFFFFHNFSKAECDI